MGVLPGGLGCRERMSGVPEKMGRGREGKKSWFPTGGQISCSIVWTLGLPSPPTTTREKGILFNSRLARVKAIGERNVMVHDVTPPHP